MLMNDLRMSPVIELCWQVTVVKYTCVSCSLPVILADGSFSTAQALYVHYLFSIAMYGVDTWAEFGVNVEFCLV